MHLGSGVPKIRVHRCRTPCKFVVGRDPLSKSTVRVKKSSSLIVLGRGVHWLKHDASSLRIIYPHDRYVWVAFHLSHLVSWCVCLNLPAVRHSVSWGRPPLNLHRSQSYAAVSHVPWKVVLYASLLCIRFN